MNILFLTSRYPTASDHYTLEKELVTAFSNNGHNCTVANILEKKNGAKSYIQKLDNNIDLLHVRTGNLFNNVTFFEKKITALSLPYIFNKSIRKYLGDKQFDLIIAYGPYLCGYNIIKPLKKLFNCKALLVQWDIFPQNAYDLGIIKNKFIFNHLKYKQKQMLAEYDLILCNSQGNIDYLAKHFPQQTNSKLYLFHNAESAVDSLKTNTVIPAEEPGSTRKDLGSAHSMLDRDDNIKQSIKLKYNIPINSTVLIFGGNIGVPQGLENIVKLAAKLQHNKKIFFIIIGQGTEASKIKALCTDKTNIKFFDFIPSKEYEELLTACDYGIISLSPKFTVPNFPAKVTAYLKQGLPIFACLDNAAYNDLGLFIKENQIGYAFASDTILKQANKIEQLLLDQEAYSNLKANTMNIFQRYFNISNIFNNLMLKIKKLSES